MKVISRAITAYIIMKTDIYPEIKQDGYIFPKHESIYVFGADKNPFSYWEGGFKTAEMSLLKFNKILRNLGKLQRVKITETLNNNTRK